jgi:Bacteriocin-protection, YdeI or OmpD-Associated/Domain of unknown function (DUF1905)
MPPAMFRATLERPEGVGTWTYLRIPAGLALLDGARTQVPVKARINGHPMRGMAQPAGDGTHFLVVKKAIRDAIGAHAGAVVEVALELDAGPRDVATPDDLAAALNQHPDLQRRFTALAYSHRREYVEWIEAAKKPETRARRIQGTLERVAQGQRLKG